MSFFQTLTFNFNNIYIYALYLHYLQPFYPPSNSLISYKIHDFLFCNYCCYIYRYTCKHAHMFIHIQTRTHITKHRCTCRYSQMHPVQYLVLLLYVFICLGLTTWDWIISHALFPGRKNDSLFFTSH